MDRFLVTAVAFASLMSASMTLAEEPTRDRDRDRDHCRDGQCEVRTREVCFNLVCDFWDYKHEGSGREDGDHAAKCRVAAKFNKDVTKDGGEVADDSSLKDNPELEVTCGGTQIYNGPARRFTDLLGTRIQGESGPFPGITLPRGALHTGPDGTAGYHVSPSRLEFFLDHHPMKLQGRCAIWTGNP